MEFLRVLTFFIFLTIIKNEVLSSRKKIRKPIPYNCICGEVRNKTIDKIVGGKITKPYAYPWQGLIKIDSGTYKCGGTVINDFYILTAGHCAYGFPINKITIELGVHNQYELNPKRHQLYKVKRKLVHENYKANPNGFHTSDIALLQLDRRITFTEFIKPICLSNKNEKMEGKTATVIGWGLTSWDADVVSTFLRETQVEVLTRKECKEQDLLRNADYTMICTTSSKQDNCAGDSGGPLFYKNINGVAVQIGIGSFGQTVCGEGEMPSYYTSVPLFLDWIQKRTKNARYCHNEL